MDRVREQADFELWARNRGLDSRRLHGGGYRDERVNLAALAWEKRARLAEVDRWQLAARSRPDEGLPVLFYAGECVEADFLCGGAWETFDGGRRADSAVLYWQYFPAVPYGPLGVGE